MSRFPIERARDEVDPDFVCQICHGILDDPKQRSDCEHVFCMPCIQSWLQSSETCAVCRLPLKSDELAQPSRFLLNRVNSIPISCEYAEHGCNTYTALENLDKHVSACDFKPIGDSSIGELKNGLQDAKNQITQLARTLDTVLGCMNIQVRSARCPSWEDYTGQKHSYEYRCSPGHLATAEGRKDQQVQEEYRIRRGLDRVTGVRLGFEGCPQRVANYPSEGSQNHQESWVQVDSGAVETALREQQALLTDLRDAVKQVIARNESSEST